MDHRIPRAGLILCVVCAALALATFAYLNEAFRGPGLTSALSDPYVLKARFKDSEVLQTKFNVAVRGVIVGKVQRITYDDADHEAVVEFTVDRRRITIHRDASASVGEFSLLGDAYLALTPGTRTAPLAPKGSFIAARPSVNFDEALDFLDATGRRDASGILDELAKATAVPDGGLRLNGTVGAISEIVPRLRSLTTALRGQEADIAALVRDSSTVLGELGGRQTAIGSIVAAGRRTVGAVAANRSALGRGIAEMPGALDAARRLLAGARPLIGDAAPLVERLEEIGPELRTVLTELPGIASELVRTGSSLSRIPTLRGVLDLEDQLGPLVPQLEAAIRNLVPIARYAAPRARGIAATFGNLAAATDSRDSDGKRARVYFNFEPGEFNDAPTSADCGAAPTAGVCHNAYPAPGDGLANQPFQAGSYPRLRAFRPRG